MTLIECFDREPIRNITGCLCLQPDKLIFLGEEKIMRAPVARYRRFLAGRGINPDVAIWDVLMDDIAQIKQVFAKIVRTEGECVIDISGGDESVLIALGAVLGDLNETERDRVTLQKFDLEDTEGLTVQEMIALHGGIVHPRTEQPESRYTPKDIQLLWDTMRCSPKEWNRSISVLNEFESRSENKYEIDLSLNSIRSGIADFEEKEDLMREFLETLDRCGVVDNRSSSNALRYRYRDALLHDCVKKAGNILEIKTLLEARSLMEQGKPYFDDCQMSVTIDWDGLVHDPAQRIPDTKNEIDVLLTHGKTPLFISCKNGNIGEEELYKLSTVAERFGGSDARKMLIATDLDRKSTIANKSFIQRAKDMQIYLVTDAAELSRENWRQIFTEAMGLR